MDEMKKDQINETSECVTEGQACQPAQKNINETPSHNEKEDLMKQLEKQKKQTKKMMITGFVCTGILAGVIGYGGGMIANSNDAQATIFTSDSQKVQVQSVAAGNPMSVQQAAALTQPSIVEIKTEQVTGGTFMPQFIQTGAGSGVIISDNGYITTNNHVIEGATNIQVRTSDGTVYKAELIGTDKKTDVAVIKIDASGLTPVVFSNSDDLNVGETAIAIGNPLGELGGTVTNGIISATARTIMLENQQMTLLQTNAAINPGNSGGGLFNDRGELIGMVVAKSAGQDVEGLGFAIPSNVVSRIAQELIKNGYVSGRPALGVTIVNVQDTQTAIQYGLNSLGVYIAEVQPGSAAMQAGLKSGDRIISLDNQVIENFAQLSSILDQYSVGDTVEIMVSRDGSTLVTSLTLQEKKTEKKETEEKAVKEIPLQ